MIFPQLDAAFRLSRLAEPTGPVDMILDTDTYNEIDDQFALAWAVLSRPQLNLQAVYAAPFHNGRSSGPGDGMLKSYDEIQRVLERLKPGDLPVLKGSTAWLSDADTPVVSDAAEDLVRRGLAQPADRPLYVVAIGAITNVASALLMEPKLVEKIVVVWLGGHPHYWPSTNEFNLRQDLHASRLMFDSGVSLVQVPCKNVAELIKTSVPEMEALLRGVSPMADYLLNIFTQYKPKDRQVWTKEIWDLAAVAWLIDPKWMPSTLTHSPLLTSHATWSFDRRRHLIRVCEDARRDAILADLMQKLAKA